MGTRHTSDLVTFGSPKTSNRRVPVQGDGGPLQLDPNNPGPISVSPSGEVSQGGMFRGRLKISEFDDPGALVSTGGDLFIAADPTVQPRAATATTVHQGFLESANTSSVTEMVNLISATRLFQANQKVVQSVDDRMARLISDVANPVS